MQRALVLTCALLGGLPAALTGSSHAAPAPLTQVQLDVDGDGRADTVSVSNDGRVAVRRADGISEALSFTQLPQLQGAFVEMWSGRGGARYLRIEGRLSGGGRALLLSVLSSGRLQEIHNGPIGPVGRDAEYSVEVKIVNGELLRYQTAPTVRRCDGETRLFLERYVEPGGFKPAPELLLLPAPGKALSTTTAAPPDLKAAPLGIYRYVAASAQAGIVRADMLTPPRELADGNRGTPWRLLGDPRGAFVTAQSDGSGHSVRALRIDAAAANQGAAPTKLILFFDDKQRLRVDLPAMAPGSAQWLVLPEPVPSRCVSIAILDGASKPGTALADLLIYSELDGAAGPKSLVERVARGSSSDAAGASRTLQELARSSPASGAELVDAAAGQLSASDLGVEGRKRLEELLLSVADLPALGNAPRERVTELLLSAIKLRAKSDRLTALAALRRTGKFGEAALSRLVTDEQATPEQRAEALALLRCLADGHPTLTQAQAALVRSVSAADEAGLKLAAALVQGLTQAQAGCADGAARTNLALALTAAFPQLPADGKDANVNAALFVARYRLLVGLERLAMAPPPALSLLQRVVTDEPEPVLRQIAARALVALKAEKRLQGLSDRDAGVRLATLASLQAAMQELSGPELIFAIEERLSADAWPQVRRVAAEVRAAACAAKPVPKAPQIPSLRKALGDADEGVQKQALIGIARCEGAGAVDILTRVAEGRGETKAGSYGPALRGLGCALVAKYGFAAPELDGATRTRAHRAAAAALLDLFGDPSADERTAAALTQCMRSLGDAGDQTELPGLFEVAGSDVPASLRTAALHSVGAICARAAAAGQALSSGTKKSLSAIVKAALGDSDAKLQSEARRTQAMCK